MPGPPLADAAEFAVLDTVARLGFKSRAANRVSSFGRTFTVNSRSVSKRLVGCLACEHVGRKVKNSRARLETKKREKRNGGGKGPKGLCAEVSQQPEPAEPPILPRKF